MIHFVAVVVFKLRDYMLDGGPVMLPLAGVSLVMWFLIVERLLFFRHLHRKNMSGSTALAHVRGARMPDPSKFCGAVSLLVAEFLRQSSGDSRLNRFIMDETIQRLNRSLDDYLAVIGVLAAVAPLLGLLGTVIGMLTTFDVLAVFGTGNARAMAGGISEALITTQTGLLVAIPGLYMHGFLKRRAFNLQQRITAVGFYLRRHL